jgi:hypothetical protein
VPLTPPDGVVVVPPVAVDPPGLTPELLASPDCAAVVPPVALLVAVDPPEPAVARDEDWPTELLPAEALLPPLEEDSPFTD